jgi:hypothetical protein
LPAHLPVMFGKIPDATQQFATPMYVRTLVFLSAEPERATAAERGPPMSGDSVFAGPVLSSGRHVFRASLARISLARRTGEGMVGRAT